MITNDLNCSREMPPELPAIENPVVNRTHSNHAVRLQVNAADTLSPQAPLQGVANCFSAMWNALVGFFTSIWNCLCGKSIEGTPAPTRAPLTPEQLTQLRATQPRDQAFWQIKMASPIRDAGLMPGDANFVDLSGRLARPGICDALDMNRIPQIGQYGTHYPIMPQLLTVKLPIRQLHLFPEAIRTEFANYDAEHLDLYLIVWRDIPTVAENQAERGKRNVIYHPVAFPNAMYGETHNHNLSMGVFEPDGIDTSRGQQNRLLPLNQFGIQNVHIHPHFEQGAIAAMAVSPDVARFYTDPARTSSSFYSACKFPNNRAAAFLGVVLNTDPNSIESAALSDSLRRPNVTLQEYKTSIENAPIERSLADKITQLLTFYTGEAGS
ncbi:MAG: hypothetical protein KF898_01375 [Parachlamydiales bacterium]|nr:hypothetical protein [Candidatus Acheromyda pituitae]